MKIRSILLDKGFKKESNALPQVIKRELQKAIIFFQSDPLHPSLRLHPLSKKWKGYWSISLDKKYRAIFCIKNEGDAYFVSVGTHAIYN